MDECHRCVGKSAPVEALKVLRQDKVQFRLLGLSATPGSRSDQITVSCSTRVGRGGGSCRLQAVWWLILAGMLPASSFFL